MVKVLEVQSELKPSIVRKYQKRAKQNKEAPTELPAVPPVDNENSKAPQEKVPNKLSPAAVKELLAILLEEYSDANALLKAKQRLINDKILKNSLEYDIISLLLDDCNNGIDGRIVRHFLEKQQEKRLSRKDTWDSQLDMIKERVREFVDVVDSCRAFLAEMSGDSAVLVDTLEAKLDFIRIYQGNARLHI